MRRLYVLRHAKSSWAVPGAKDFDRHLNERGMQDAKKLGTYMQTHNQAPTLILCSPAQRTKETLESLRFALPEGHEVNMLSELYSGNLSDYFEAVRALDGALSVMLIGHNPMCGNFAAALSGSGDEASMERIRHKYPTCTMSVIDFDIENWQDLKEGTGSLEMAITPSKLV